MFTDGPGNCMQAVIVQAGVSTYPITAPSPAFGPGND
jgi:hypothetical protein